MRSYVAVAALVGMAVARAGDAQLTWSWKLEVTDDRGRLVATYPMLTTGRHSLPAYSVSLATGQQVNVSCTVGLDAPEASYGPSGSWSQTQGAFIMCQERGLFFTATGGRSIVMVPREVPFDPGGMVFLNVGNLHFSLRSGSNAG